MPVIVAYVYMKKPVSKTCSSSLRDFAVSQDLVYQKKTDEKLRSFLNLSSGKASLVAELLSSSNVELLQANRLAIWNWVQGGSSNVPPLLPSEFPSRFHVVKLGPICVGSSSPAPTIDELLSWSAPMESQRLRKISAGEYTMTVSLSSLEAYTSLAERLNLRKSEWYEESFWGSILTKQYGSVPVSLSVTSLGIIAESNSNGLMGKEVQTGPEKEEDVKQIWLDSELALIDASIISAAGCAAEQSSLRLRRDVLYRNVDPGKACWRGDVGRLKRESTIGGSRLAHKLGLGVGALSNRKVFEFVQGWFSRRVVPYSKTSTDPGPTDTYGRLHFLLGTCMEKEEELGGSVKTHLKTPLSNLSLFDPESNVDGIFLCPTYLPSHAIRLCEWFENNLPELDCDLAARDEKICVHFLHIDGEGAFFQLHTESGGCVVIFTGKMEAETELFAEISRQFRLFDFARVLESLASMTRAICREFTLSRPDVVFGGDRAACPIASQSVKTRTSEKILPWIESDISNWFWFIEGCPGQDFFCVRSIDPKIEELVEKEGPVGFKNLIDSAAGQLAGDVCMCKRVFGADWLRQCGLAHPQMWHSYPQSGAGQFKNLTEPCHWTVLYYAIADLVKARSLTFAHTTVDIEIVTPTIINNG